MASASVTWTSPAGLPGADPYSNNFPRLLTLNNGTTWLVWQKTVQYGQVWMMANNGFGWGGETPLLANSTWDDIAPAMAQLNNGTVILAWSRGTPGNLSSYNIYTESYAQAKWSKPAALVTGSPSNFDPDLVRLYNGSIMLVWSRVPTIGGNGELFYRILANGAWGAEHAVPNASSGSSDDKLPSIFQSFDGRIWVIFQSNRAGTPQIWYTMFSGNTWANPTSLTTTSNPDDWPSLAQDRNGSIWAFWTRELPNGTQNGQTVYQSDIFARYSPNNGLAWNPEFNFTNSTSTNDEHAFIYQVPDKKLWVVYDSYGSRTQPGNPYGVPNLFISKSGTILAHDLAVQSIANSPVKPRVGEIVNISVTVQDLGDYAESSQVKLYVDNVLLGAQNFTLQPNNLIVTHFTWNSTGRVPTSVPSFAKVLTVSGEAMTQNNSLNSSIPLVPKGDVNRDGIVNIVDLTLVASRFGATSQSANYLPDADLDHDGTINIVDLAIVASDFGDASR